jgi:hypothetical protein
VQEVGATAQLWAIRQAAYSDVQTFRGLRGRAGARRQELERISDQLQGLELRLSYSVKSSADFGLLVLSMRAESFHQALYESMGLAGRATAAAARM